MVLLQKLVGHHLKKVRNDGHIPMPLIEKLVDANRVCSAAQHDLKEKHGPSVDAPFWFQLFGSESLCFGWTAFVVESGLLNDAETGVLEHAIDIFVEYIRSVLVQQWPDPNGNELHALCGGRL
jgi:hypothetical protein